MIHFTDMRFEQKPMEKSEAIEILSHTLEIGKRIEVKYHPPKSLYNNTNTGYVYYRDSGDYVNFESVRIIRTM